MRHSKYFTLHGEGRTVLRPNGGLELLISPSGQGSGALLRSGWSTWESQTVTEDASEATFRRPLSAIPPPPPPGVAAGAVLRTTAVLWTACEFDRANSDNFSLARGKGDAGTEARIAFTPDRKES